MWKPIVDAEHEYARTRAAVAVEHARREIQDSAMKRCAEMNESLKSALASATERRDAANRAFPRRPPSIAFFSSREGEERPSRGIGKAADAEARFAEVDAEVAAERALVAARVLQRDDSTEQFQRVREQRETERSVLALHDALGKSDEDLVDFLWAVEQKAPYSVVALHRYRRETSRLKTVITRDGEDGADDSPRRRPRRRAGAVDTMSPRSDAEEYDGRADLMPLPSL